MNLIKSLNYFQWAPSEEKCLETCSIVWSSTSNGTTNQNKTAERRKERKPRKKRATDGAQQIRGGMRSFKTAKLLTSRARSRYNLTPEVFLLLLGRIFQTKKVIKLEKNLANRGYQCNSD